MSSLSVKPSDTSGRIAAFQMEVDKLTEVQIESPKLTIAVLDTQNRGNELCLLYIKRLFKEHHPQFLKVREELNAFVTKVKDRNREIRALTEKAFSKQLPNLKKEDNEYRIRYFEFQSKRDQLHEYVLLFSRQVEMLKPLVRGAEYLKQLKISNKTQFEETNALDATIQKRVEKAQEWENVNVRTLEDSFKVDFALAGQQVGDFNQKVDSPKPTGYIPFFSSVPAYTIPPPNGSVPEADKEGNENEKVDYKEKTGIRKGYVKKDFDEQTHGAVSSSSSFSSTSSPSVLPISPFLIPSTLGKSFSSTSTLPLGQKKEVSAIPTPSSSSNLSAIPEESNTKDLHSESGASQTNIVKKKKGKPKPQNSFKPRNSSFNRKI